MTAVTHAAAPGRQRPCHQLILPKAFAANCMPHKGSPRSRMHWRRAGVTGTHLAPPRCHQRPGLTTPADLSGCAGASSCRWVAGLLASSAAERTHVLVASKGIICNRRERSACDLRAVDTQPRNTPITCRYASSAAAPHPSLRSRLCGALPATGRTTRCQATHGRAAWAETLS